MRSVKPEPSLCKPIRYPFLIHSYSGHTLDIKLAYHESTLIIIAIVYHLSSVCDIKITINYKDIKLILRLLISLLFLSKTRRLHK